MDREKDRLVRKEERQLARKHFNKPRWVLKVKKGWKTSFKCSLHPPNPFPTLNLGLHTLSRVSVFWVLVHRHLPKAPVANLLEKLILSYMLLLKTGRKVDPKIKLEEYLMGSKGRSSYYWCCHCNISDTLQRFWVSSPNLSR